MAREARSESKSSYAAVRVHSARLPSGRTLPDPFQDLALPGTGTELLVPCTCVPVAGPAERYETPPLSTPCRAEYPRGPPRVA